MGLIVDKRDRRSSFDGIWINGHVTHVCSALAGFPKYSPRVSSVVRLTLGIGVYTHSGPTGDDCVPCLRRKYWHGRGRPHSRNLPRTLRFLRIERPVVTQGRLYTQPAKWFVGDIEGLPVEVREPRPFLAPSVDQFGQDASKDGSQIQTMP